MAQDGQHGDRVIPHWYDPESDRITVVEGDDATVYDEEGESYLDFISQLYCCNAGHGNKRITDAIESQLDRIQYVASAKHNDARSRLAEDLIEVAPGDLSEVFFAISGSEANETATHVARTVQDAPTVLTRWQSYHGGTLGAGGLTGDPSTRKTVQNQVAATGTAKFLPPLPDAFDTDDPDELARRAADHVEYVIRNEGPDSVAAILVEPLGGTSGAYPAPPGYFERLRDICDEYDVLLIADEVITGFGRVGEWFGIQSEGVTPDLLTFAKAVTSAYVPLAGVMVDEDVGQALTADSYDLGQTFGGHPVACAAGEAAMDVYRDDLIERGRDVAPYLESRLDSLADRFDVVDTVRGRGLLWSVVFADPETGDPFVHPWVDPEADNPVASVRSEAQDRGVLTGAGRPDDQIILAPPLCITEDEIDEAVETLAESIRSVFDTDG
ncbi:MAG: aspartate aminotransferase family protein [Halodesulfurarchaeum sp.]